MRTVVEWWVSLLGAVLPAVLAGQALSTKRRQAEKQRLESAQGLEKSSDEIFVCKRVYTSKRMLKMVSAFSEDPTLDTCVTVCGVSELDACADAFPYWNDICLRRCQSECLRLSNSSAT
ncbi:hypothetical protein NMG60_11031334 [Bertholletia excelsa]